MRAHLTRGLVVPDSAGKDGLRNASVRETKEAAARYNAADRFVEFASQGRVLESLIAEERASL
jgi:hypothetical protein